MKKIFLLTIIALSSIACNKKQTITIQAQNYTNLADGSHYAGAKFDIIQSRVGLVGSVLKTVYIGELNENGQAIAEIKMKNNRIYRLNILTPDDICYAEVNTRYILESMQNNDVIFKYAPCGYVIVPTNNVNCEGINDKMQYKYYIPSDLDIYIYRGFGDYLDWSKNTFVESCVSFPGSYNSIPIGDYTIEWRVIRPSDTTTGIDYFTVTENDTTNYLIEY